MVPSELLKHLSSTLDRLGIPYLVTGSTASITYGEPRFTNDIDVVVAMKSSQATDLCAAFPSPDYYCSLTAVAQAIRDRFQFNILHPASGLKVDVIMATDSEFDRSRLARSRRLPAGDDFETTFAAPEDVILKKLEYFRVGGSDKHLRDIVGILKVQGDRIDRRYLDEWVARLSVKTEWDLIEMRLKDART
jgi:hypothetical protein